MLARHSRIGSFRWRAEVLSRLPAQPAQILEVLLRTRELGTAPFLLDKVTVPPVVRNTDYGSDAAWAGPPRF